MVCAVAGVCFCGQDFGVTRRARAANALPDRDVRAVRSAFRRDTRRRSSFCFALGGRGRVCIVCFLVCECKAPRRRQERRADAKQGAYSKHARRAHTPTTTRAHTRDTPERLLPTPSIAARAERSKQACRRSGSKGPSWARVPVVEEQ